jgi:hypothetical protein
LSLLIAVSFQGNIRHALEKLGWKVVGALSLALFLLHVAAELLRVLHIA